MLPVLTLVIFMAFSAILGAESRHKKSTQYIMIAAIALSQTLLLLLDMYTMKMPKGSYLP
jgi:hypothetical protein